MKGTDMETKTIHLALSPRVAMLVARVLPGNDHLLYEMTHEADDGGLIHRRMSEALNAVVAEIASQGVEMRREHTLVEAFSQDEVSVVTNHVETPEPDVSTPDAKAIADKMAKAGREAAEGETREDDDGER